MKGEVVTLTEDINPAYYKDFIFIDIHRNKCMYAESKKATYRTLVASLLFWTKLSKILEEIDYKRNEYDWCVMNKIVKGKTFTILWNV